MSKTINALRVKLAAAQAATAASAASSAPAAPAAPAAAPAAPAAAPTSAPTAAADAPKVANTTQQGLANLAALSKTLTTPKSASAPAAPAAPAAAPAAPAAAPVADAPKVAGAPVTALTEDQIIKLASERINADAIDTFDKVAHFVGSILLSSQDGFAAAETLIQRAKGAEIATNLMAKAAGYRMEHHARLEQEEMEKAAAVEQERLQKEAFDKLSPDQQAYVKRAFSIHAQNAAALDRQLHVDLLALEGQKSASVAEKTDTANFLRLRTHLLKLAMQAGAQDAAELMEQAGPEGANEEAAVLPGAEEIPAGPEGQPGLPEMSIPELIQLIDEAVQAGELTPEQGEQAKMVLAQSESPEAGMEGPGAEEAKAAHALTAEVLTPAHAK